MIKIPSPEHALTPPPPATEISIPKTSSQVGKVWSGKISVPDTGTFSANGYIISGNIDSTTVQNSLQHQLKVGGRLDYEVVNKVRLFSCVSDIYCWSAFQSSVFWLGNFKKTTVQVYSWSAKHLRHQSSFSYVPVWKVSGRWVRLHRLWF